MVGALQTNQEDRFVRALQCFMIVPQFALVRDSGRPPQSGRIRTKLNQFIEGEWTQPNSFRGEEKKDDSGKTEQFKKSVKRAIRQAQDGNVRKASAALETAASGLSGIQQPSPDVVQRLRDMHPPESQPVPPLPEGLPIGLPVTRAALRRAGVRIANGAAPDVFGWTGELVRTILQDKQCLEYLAKVVEYIRDGCIGDEGRDWLLSSWLIALDKGQGKVRPIAGSTALFKLAAAYLMEQGRDEAQSFFEKSGIQLGVFVQDGVASAARLTQLMLEANPKHIVLKTDFKNAFNNVPRRLVLEQLFAQQALSRFFRMVHWTYSAPSMQFVRGDRGVKAVILSREGVRQGCVFGSLGYAIATLDMFRQVRDAHPGVLVVAILDDLCLSGDPSQVISAFDKLQELANVNCIPIQLEKCEVLVQEAPGDDIQQRLLGYQFKQADGVLPLLGTVVGRDTVKKMNWVNKKVESWQPIFDVLQGEDFPSQVSLLIARWTGTAKHNYLARSLPAEVTCKAFQQLDETTKSCVEKRLDLSFASFSDFMFRLPLSHGGAGFTRAVDSAGPAFVASVATTLRFVGNTPLQGYDLLSLPTFNGALMKALNLLKRKNAVVDGLPVDVAEFIKKFRKPSTLVRGLQKKLNAKMMSALQEEYFQKGQHSKQESFHFESRQSPLCAAPYKAYPFTSEFALTNEETRFMVAHATGCKPKEMPTFCSCGKPLDMSHCTSCGPNQLTRHNRLQGRFVAFAREQGCATEQNPRVTVDDARNQQEPDVVFYFGSGRPVEADITVVNPTAPSYVSRSIHPAGGAALAIAEGRKENKYDHHAYRRGRHFSPLAFETQGRMSDHILTLLKRIAAQTESGTGLAVGDMVMDLQMALVRGNAECAQTVLARAARAEDKSRGAQFPIPHASRKPSTPSTQNN